MTIAPVVLKFHCLRTAKVGALPRRAEYLGILIRVSRRGGSASGGQAQTEALGADRVSAVPMGGSEPGGTAAVRFSVKWRFILHGQQPQIESSVARFGSTAMYHGNDTSMVFGILELPFLFIAVFFAFLVAAKLRGGSFGIGMWFLAWGFLVMAIGHLAMQIERYTQVNLFASLFGARLGDIVWIIALVITWTLSSYGFYRIYRAASGG